MITLQNLKIHKQINYRKSINLIDSNLNININLYYSTAILTNDIYNIIIFISFKITNNTT